MSRTAKYSIAVYLIAALLLVASYQLHLILGGDRFKSIELWSTFIFFSVWMPFMPLVVWLARRFFPTPGRRLRVLEIHFFAALALAFITLFGHKLVLCPQWCYFSCITYFRAEAWMSRWFALDYFIYAGVVASVWVSIIAERMREREMRAIAIERELASAELSVVRTHVNPESLIEMFREIERQVEHDPAEAERMIMSVAEYLRLKLRELEGPAGATS